MKIFLKFPQNFPQNFPQIFLNLAHFPQIFLNFWLRKLRQKNYKADTMMTIVVFVITNVFHALDLEVRTVFLNSKTNISEKTCILQGEQHLDGALRKSGKPLTDHELQEARTLEFSSITHRP